MPNSLLNANLYLCIPRKCGNDSFLASAQSDTCIQDLVRCVALTRLVYGERHLKLAQAHVRLAKAYFTFKGNFKKNPNINYKYDILN